MSEGAEGTVARATGSGWLETRFHLRENGTTVQTEVMAGLTTFMVMSYIIAVNPSILNRGGSGLPVREVATVTCLVAGIMTIAMGLYTNRALALAPGLGLNAIVSFTLADQMGLGFPAAMGVVVTEGVVITILVLLGIRQYVMDAVPLVLKKAISVGIGFFILFIGLVDAGLITFILPSEGITGTTGSLLSLSPLNTWPIFVTLLGLTITIVLYARGVKGAILIGIVASTIIAFLVPGNVATWPDNPFAGPNFSLIGNVSFDYWSKLGFLTAVLVVFSLMLADFFDTMGTLVGVGSEAGYLDENGNFPDANKPLLIDSLAAAAGGLMSASSATTYVESASGVAVGGRTGLVSVVTGVLFLIALPFVNLVQAVPQAATAPALIFVGFLMVGVLTERETMTADGKVIRTRGIDFNNIEEGLPIVLTMLLMPLTFSITNGIGAGFVSYVLVKLARGKARDVHPGVYLVALAFLIYFLRFALFNAKF
ncbi:MAG TPA: NCS2 family permease [Thermomicrobiales bacterium]|nr:NCS2 family permease [Thermomicrobiales bacterium]